MVLGSMQSWHSPVSLPLLTFRKIRNFRFGSRVSGWALTAGDEGDLAARVAKLVDRMVDAKLTAALKELKQQK